ncbi:MAG: hypothetical protein WAS21_32595 [Geminicoccaceae bacterium]
MPRMLGRVSKFGSAMVIAFSVAAAAWAHGITERVSLGPSGTQSNPDSFLPAISAGRRFVAFQSFATNLVSGDTNGVVDVFVRDRQTGTTQRVSLGPGGVQADLGGYLPAISADERFVAFTSRATNPVRGDTNVFDDVFVRTLIP